MLPQEDLDLEIDPDPELEQEAEETAQRVMEGGELGIHRMEDADVHVQRVELSDLNPLEKIENHFKKVNEERHENVGDSYERRPQDFPQDKSNTLKYLGDESSETEKILAEEIEENSSQIQTNTEAIASVQAELMDGDGGIEADDAAMSLAGGTAAASLGPITPVLAGMASAIVNLYQQSDTDVPGMLRSLASGSASDSASSRSQDETDEGDSQDVVESQR